MKVKFIYFLLLPAVLYGFASCTLTRDDLHKLASLLPAPEIEVLGFPHNDGSYNFGPQEVYTAAVKTFTITNTGTKELRIQAISIDEEDETWFTINSSSMTSLLPKEGNTNFTVKFKPTSNEHRSIRVIILSDDEDENPYTFTVEGNGYGTPVLIPDMNVKQGTIDILNGNPSPIEFGNVEVDASSAKMFTIENTGQGELSIFDISALPGSGTTAGEFSVIAPDIPAALFETDNTDFTVVFKPNTTGLKSATIVIQNDDPDESPYSFTVQGNGSPVPHPDINVKQGPVDLPYASGIYNFGYVESSTSSSPVSFTIENRGTATLDISSVSVTFGDPLQFIVDTSPPMVFSISPGSSTSFLITFAPNVIEEHKSATITINNNDPDEWMYTFMVEGWGVASPVPDIHVVEVSHDETYDFGPVLLGSSKSETFTIVNTGTGDLHISDVENKDPDKFSLDAATVDSPVSSGGGSTYFTVTYTPTKDSKEKATIEIHSDDPDEDVFKFKVSAYGSKGPEPDINVKQGSTSYPDGSEYYFPDTEVGNSSAPIEFSIVNNGTDVLVIKSLMLDGGDIKDFDFDYDPASISVPPGGELILTMWFKPTKHDNRDTKIKIESNDPDEEKYEIKLYGNGI